MNDSIFFFHNRWPVFFEDNHLLVLYKPAGLIMQRDHKNKANMLDLAKLWIKIRHTKPGKAFAGLVHRLDGPVAGVVVVARTSKGASRLSAQFRQGTVEKRYLALVMGRPPKPADRIMHHLERDGRRSKIVPAGNAGGQSAALSYKLLDARDQHSLVAITLETGRRHQIRVQLAALGCPIIGDVQYGAPKAMAHGRIALLAHKISFDHPTRKERLLFNTPLPRGWPWPANPAGPLAPLWAIEEYMQDGLVFPDVPL